MTATFRRSITNDGSRHNMKILQCQNLGANPIRWNTSRIRWWRSSWGSDGIMTIRNPLLEQALVDNLEKFILELGRGFAFVERQKHIVTDTADFYVDLVFYNFKMKRFVIFELKTHKLTHQDIGQLDMYVRMYDDLIKGTDDAPTIGVLLCTDTDSTIARYSVLHDSDQLYAAKYMTYMPTEEELRHEIEQQKRFFLEQHEKEELE